MVLSNTKTRPPIAPALAKVTIYEVAHYPRAEFITTAEVGARVYVGSREWRQRNWNDNKSCLKRA
jgi:hypothetical protein